jgi:hypothetical protein
MREGDSVASQAESKSQQLLNQSTMPLIQRRSVALEEHFEYLTWSYWLMVPKWLTHRISL